MDDPVKENGSNTPPPRPSGAITASEKRLLMLAGAPALPSTHRRAPPAAGPDPEPLLEWARSTGLYTPLEAEAVLEALLLESSGTVASALCRAVPAQDEGMAVLLEFFEAHGRGFELVVGEMTREVQHTPELHLLLRGRSAAARFITHYVRLAADEYLTRLVSWVLSEVRALPHAIEIDPNASPPPPSDAAREASLEALRQLSGALLQRLVSGPAPPIALRRLAHEFVMVVSARFSTTPDVAQVALGAFFFLRILCPAIAIASASVTAPERRALTLLSKVLQQEANGVPFSEAFMAPLTPLLAQHKPLMAALVQTLPLAAPPSPLPSAPLPIRVPPARRSLGTLASRIAALMPELLPEINTPPIRLSRPIAYAPLPRLNYLLDKIICVSKTSAPLPINGSNNSGSATPPSSPGSYIGSESPGGSGTSSKRGGLAKHLTSGLVAIGRSGRLVLRLLPGDHSSSSSSSSNNNVATTSGTPPAVSPPPSPPPPPPPPPSVLAPVLSLLLVNKHVAEALLSVAAHTGRGSVNSVVTPLLRLAGSEQAPRIIKRLLKSGRSSLATTALRSLAASFWTDFLRGALSTPLSGVVANLAAAEKSVADNAERLDLENFSTEALLHDAATLFAAVANAITRCPPALRRLAGAHQKRSRAVGRDGKSEEELVNGTVEFVVYGVFVQAVAAPDEWNILKAGLKLSRVTRTLLELLSKMLLLASISSAFRAPNTTLIDHFLQTGGAPLRAAFQQWIKEAVIASPPPARGVVPVQVDTFDINCLNQVATFASDHRAELVGLLTSLQFIEQPQRPLQQWIRQLFAVAQQES